MPNYEATVVLPGDVRIPGGSVTVPMGDDAETVSGEFIYAGDIPAAGVDAEDAALCQIDTLDEAAAAGKIVLCDRGVNARAEKSQVVADAGGIATVLVNVTPGSIDLDDHAVPTIHVDAEYRDELLAAADGTTVISFEPGNTSGIETIAGSSPGSRRAVRCWPRAAMSSSPTSRLRASASSPPAPTRPTASRPTSSSRARRCRPRTSRVSARSTWVCTRTRRRRRSSRR